MYEQLLDFQHLYASYKLTCRGKQREKTTVNYSMNLSKNLWDLQQKLERREFKFSNYHRFYVLEPKRREIDALEFKDRIVQHCLCDYILGIYLDKRLIYDNASCRKGKGTHFAMKRLTGFMKEHYEKNGVHGYILKFDIRKYFENIDHQVLKQKLNKFPDEEVKNLLYQVIDSYEHTKGKGIPMGNQTSQWFALYYLDSLDRMIKEQLNFKYYTRYMDDGIIIHKDKAYLKKALKIMKEEVEKLGLQFNEKTAIFPMKQGVDYLGFHFYITETGKIIRRLRTSAKKRYKRNMKQLSSQYYQGEKSIKEVNQYIQSYKGHLKHGHTYGLQKRVLRNTVFKREENREPNEEAVV